MELTNTYNYLLVPGYGGIEMQHWMRHWARWLPNAHFVKQKDFQNPVQEVWVDALAKKAQGLPDKPIVLIAHSLGVLTSVVAALEHKLPEVAASFLVAPPEPERTEFHDGSWQGFLPFPAETLPFPSYLVYGSNDEYSTTANSTKWATHWGCTAKNAGENGHLGSSANLGNWPLGQEMFKQLIQYL